MVITEVFRKGERFEVITDEPVAYKIHLTASGYARIFVGGKITRLHRWLLGATSGELVDHINGNKLDNRKVNLRFVTHQQNAMNKRARGTAKVNRSTRFEARVETNGKLAHLSYHDTEEQAHEAYKEAHSKLFGRFSPYGK